LARSELDAALGEDAFGVGVFDLAHFGDGVGEFDEEGVGVAAGEDDVGHLVLAAEGFGDGFRGEHVVADGVVDLVEDDEVPVAGEDGGDGLVPCGLDEADVFGVGFGAADFDEAAAKLLDDEGGGGGVEEPLRNCRKRTDMPLPAARRAVPRAAVVLPLPGPVLMRMRPRRVVSGVCSVGGMGVV